ncbi:MAG: AbrB/MazE/SpoVT family DNA-binding domain-containing protein [Bacillota bacterium]|nr:AbrB/MazE/SpoVT family DNA-binding domain-containing protein [Bacillota bacterium]
MAMIIERSRITGKGQVQLPARIRQAAGVKVGDQVTFKMGDDGKVEVEFVITRPLTRYAGALPKRKEYPGLDEEERLTRQLVAEKRAKYDEQE